MSTTLDCVTENMSSQATFQRRHLGVSPDVAEQMAGEIGFESVQQLVDAAVPDSIRRQQPFDLPAAVTETGALALLKQIDLFLQRPPSNRHTIR